MRSASPSPRRTRLSLALVLLLPSCGTDPADPTGDSESDASESDASQSDATGTPATTGDPTTAADTSDTTDTNDEAEVWKTPYCHPVKDGPAWPPPLPDWEDEVLRLVNEARAAGHDCDSKGKFGPAPPLTMNASLRCAARKHAADMANRNYFDHVSPEGETFIERIAQAGYGSYAQIGENIAGGVVLDNARAAVDGWLDSDGHCANIMNEFYTELGAGVAEGPGDLTYYWTQEFGRPL